MQDRPDIAAARIAIVAVRLEHVTRGVETWARDLFEVLHARGFDVTLYKGSGACGSPRERVLRSIKKQCRLSRLIMRVRPGFCWRIGLGSGDTLEETTFALGLIRELRRHRFDIVHLQDAHAANLLRAAAARGIIKTRVILAHGTEESPDFLSRFPYVQHLAPYHQQETVEALGGECGTGILPVIHGRDAHATGEWTAIPNFVDTERFRPPRDAAEKRACRAALELPEDAFIVLSAAAIKRGHKRIDYLIRELAALADPRIHLLVAGAREADTESLRALAADCLGSRARLICDLPHDRMPEVFRTADLFALCSLKEMMPIALLEALGTGLPALVHHYPVLEWMIGGDRGGVTVSMDREGALTAAVAALAADPDTLARLSDGARRYALEMFSKDAVTDQIVDLYARVLASPAQHSHG